MTQADTAGPDALDPDIENRGGNLIAFGRKLAWGYLPWSAAGVACIGLLISRSQSWEALIAGGIFFAIFSALFLVAQLTLFALPSQPRRRFVLWSGALSIVNLLITMPLLGFAMAWTVRALRTL